MCATCAPTYTVHTFVQVSISKRLQNIVHGPHVEDESELSHAHCDEAEHEYGAEDALHEGLGCRETKITHKICHMGLKKWVHLYVTQKLNFTIDFVTG